MNQESEKRNRIIALGKKRKNSCYENYFQISHFHEGKYESIYVSPYTNSANNVNSSIVVLLQDWSSENSLLRPFDQKTAKLGYTTDFPTNRNLKDLLKSTFDLNFEDVFITNVFPFIKKGSISSNIPQQDMNRAFTEFCYPQIDIIKPKLVICCGKKVYISALNHFNKSKKNLQAVGNNFHENNIVFYHQRHTGRIATNVSGGIDVAKNNWKEMTSIFKHL